MLDDCPTHLDAPPRIIVIGDLHGDVGRLMKMLFGLGVISADFEWTASPPDTCIVQLGDQVDSATRSGPDTAWEKLPDLDLLYMMDRLDSLARPHGGRVISLLGNHELMNVFGIFDYVSRESLGASGGADVRRAKFQPGSELAMRLARRCVVLRIGRCLFVHAALLPRHMAALGNDLDKINRLVRRFLRRQPLTEEEGRLVTDVALGPDSITWSREFADVRDPAELTAALDSVLRTTGCSAIFTGHNTVSSITPLDGGRLWLCDAGFSRAYNTTRMQVLDVRGNEVHILTGDEAQ